MNMLDKLLAYAHQYPEFVAIILGTLASWAGAGVLDYYLPEGWTARRIKQWTVAANIIIGTVVSAIIWHGLDPTDSSALNWTASFACALVSVFSYTPIAQIITHFFPWFQSSWAKPPGEKP